VEAALARHFADHGHLAALEAGPEVVSGARFLAFEAFAGVGAGAGGVAAADALAGAGGAGG